MPPNSTAHNVIVGSTWVDCHGNFSLTNVTTGAKCSLYFTPCGWFSDGRYQVYTLLPTKAACHHSSPCTTGGLQQGVRMLQDRHVLKADNAVLCLEGGWCSQGWQRLNILRPV